MRIEELFYPLSKSEVDEENFDLEKWREEKPMDYFKALFALNKAEGICVLVDLDSRVYTEKRMEI